MCAWICSQCGADVDEDWSVCWQCGASSDGNVDKSFVPEVDVATLPPGWIPRIRCSGCGYAGKVLLRHHGYQWWTLPVSILLTVTLVGAIPWAIIFIVLGNLRERVCPQCRRRDELHDWHGAPGKQAERIWSQAHAEDESRFLKNRITLLVFSTVALILSGGYFVATILPH